MKPGFYFATHKFGWRSVVEVREAVGNVPTPRMYVVILNSVGKMDVSEFSAWKRIEER